MNEFTLRIFDTLAPNRRHEIIQWVEEHEIDTLTCEGFDLMDDGSVQFHLNKRVYDAHGVIVGRDRTSVTIRPVRTCPWP